MNKFDDYDEDYEMFKKIMKNNNYTVEEISNKAQQYVELRECNDSELKEYIIKKYQENIGVKAYSPDVLLSSYNNGDSWINEITSLNQYFNRYEEYLNKKDFPVDVIDKIRKSTEEILSNCSNPKDYQNTNNKKKGLVIGDVQSGKTANYIALMNMAADYGYKQIVLLAGMTDSLRIQTQKRVDDGFIGANSSSINGDIIYVGVGKKDFKYWSIPMTNQDYDFIKFIKENTNYNTMDLNKPVVLVVKKNTKTLTQVKDWIKPEGNILIIDDEADNASINTKSKEDPSKINSLIRDIYNKVPIASYVGYTATPYSNVFINPYDDENNKDLFPSDFIVLLNEPDNYFGAKKVFNDNSNKHIKILNEREKGFLPVKHKKDNVVFDELPESLIDAINDFILVNVIRTLDGKKNAHRSMMINISVYNNVQEVIKNRVEEYIEKISKIIEQTYLLPIEDCIKDPAIRKIYDKYIKDSFFEEYKKIYTWDKIQKKLCYEIKMFNVALFNKKDRFVYEEFEDVGARVIAIGGYVLSRGVTLEGLMISYFSRNANAYDTMLQMCRWFGYRNGYENLCRIYISTINIQNYRAIIDAIDDLKEQFREMKIRHKTPNEFGLMIKESPDTLETKLLITSRNKMKNSKVILRGINYSGADIDTSKLYKSKEINLKNLKGFENLIDNLKKDGILFTEYNGRNMFINVDKSIISRYISSIKVPLENRKFDIEGISEYIENSKEFPLWDIVIATGDKKDSEQIKYTIANKEILLPLRSFTSRDEEDFIRISDRNNRLAEPGIFNSGLSERQKNELKEKKRKLNKGITSSDYLSVEGRKPLLVIYLINLRTNGVENESECKATKNNYGKNIPVVGYAIGFPGIDSKVIIKYRANEIKLRRIEKDFDDEEEDMIDED